MSKFYLINKNGSMEEITDAEYSILLENKELRQYVSKLYREVITINEVPEALRDFVQMIVNKRIDKYGSYNSQPATVQDINRLINALTNRPVQLTKGEVNQLISALTNVRDASTDEIASCNVNVFPCLKHDGSLIKAGTRIQWAGVIKRAAVDLWDTVENNPDDAPTLWEDLNYLNGYRTIPEVITVGTAFNIDECGWWKDKLYKSLINANVYTPDQYSAGWQEVDI